MHVLPAYIVMFLTIIFPAGLFLAIIIGIPIYAIRRYRQEEETKHKVFIVLGSAFAIPICLIIAEGISVGLLYLLQMIFGKG